MAQFTLGVRLQRNEAMTAIVDTLSTENLIIFAFMIYLLGVATPVILLRAIAQNHQDTCFLTVILWGIVIALGTMLISLTI